MLDRSPEFSTYLGIKKNYGDGMIILMIKQKRNLKLLKQSWTL
jgi:hypothetical protein